MGHTSRIGTSLALLAALGLGCGGDREPLPAVVVDLEVMDVVEAFERGDTHIELSHPELPLEALPAVFEADTELATDTSDLMIRAHAESAFEVTTPPLRLGARLVARTMVYTPFWRDPEKADPAPVTFRILVNGEVREALRSDYILDPSPPSDHAYDRLMRTLEVDLGPWDGQSVTLRFETTRLGEPPPGPGEVGPEPLWWDIALRQPVAVARQRSGPDAPNLLVLCVDTLAAGRMSAFGYDRDTTPNLARFAERGTVFDVALAPSSWTLPATASLLTGLPPNTHGVLGDTRSYLMEGLTTWPELLRQQGLEGAAFVSNPLVAEANNFQQGFGTWVQDNGPEGDGTDADELNARFLAWLDNEPPGGAWFAYVHYMDPHAPYDAPGEHRDRYAPGYVERRSFRGHLPRLVQQEEVAPFAPDEQQHVVDLYDAEVTFFDACFGELLTALEQRGLLDRTVIVLTSDHGEELFEHGRLGHGYALFEEMLRVPLVMAGPRVPAGRRLSQPVSTASLFNTLLRLGGVETLPGAARSLLPVEEVLRRDEVVYSSTRTHLFGPRTVLISGRDSAGRKVVLEVDDEGDVVRRQYYALAAGQSDVEPLEIAGLTSEESAAFASLEVSTVRWHRESSRARPAEHQPVNEDIEQLLKAVGYLGGAEDVDAAIDEEGSR